MASIIEITKPYNVHTNTMLLGNILRYNDLDENSQLLESLLNAFNSLLRVTNTNFPKVATNYLSTCDNEEI